MLVGPLPAIASRIFIIPSLTESLISESKASLIICLAWPGGRNGCTPASASRSLLIRGSLLAASVVLRISSVRASISATLAGGAFGAVGEEGRGVPLAG